jgi:hypothetical protein
MTVARKPYLRTAVEKKQRHFNALELDSIRWNLERQEHPSSCCGAHPTTGLATRFKRSIVDR